MMRKLKSTITWQPERPDVPSILEGTYMKVLVLEGPYGDYPAVVIQVTEGDTCRLYTCGSGMLCSLLRGWEGYRIRITFKGWVKSISSDVEYRNFEVEVDT